MSDFKRVLVSSPTAAVKNYCFEQWIENVMGFTYPEFDIALYDNTDDKGANCEYLNAYVKENFGALRKFEAINTIEKRKIAANSVIAKMSYSHNDCRAHTLNGSYDYLLHLETDIFPPKDVIERLMFHGKNLVGAVYYVGEGTGRIPMVTERIELSKNAIASMWSFSYGGELRLFDGNIHEVAQVGLGCVLISKKVLERIAFRYDPNRTCHPDTLFSEDCAEMKVATYVDSSIICRHENQAWGIYGIDYK